MHGSTPDLTSLAALHAILGDCDRPYTAVIHPTELPRIEARLKAFARGDGTFVDDH